MALSQEQIMSLPGPLQQHFIKLERDIVARLCKHIGDIGQLTTTDLLMLDELQRIGYNMQTIQSEITNIVDRSEQEVLDLFKQAAEAEYDKYKEVFDITGKKWVPFSENERLMDLVESISRTTSGTFQNMSNTMGFVNTRGAWQPLSQTYRQTVDYAIMQLKSGQTDFYSAMRQSVRTLADNGISIISWESGYRRRVDSSVRQNILGGLADLSQQQAMMIGEEIGADGMEITFHLGYRPTHDFGGLQFSMREYLDRILPLMQEWNCYHRAFPIVLGISKSAYSREQLKEMIAKHEEVHYFEGKPYNQYKAEQKQRIYETAIRKQKDRINAFEAARDTEATKIARTKLNQLNTSYREFSKAVELKPKRERTTVVKLIDKTPSTPKDVKKIGHLTKNELLDSLDGYSKSQKQEFVDSVEYFTGTGYQNMRGITVVDPRADIIENAIANSNSRWSDGELYRGINIGGDPTITFKPGTIINQNGLSSWSSSKDIAHDFAKVNLEKNQVIFVDKTQGSRGAISIRDLSKGREYEDEVIYSAHSNFNIMNVRTETVSVLDPWTDDYVDKIVYYIDISEVK